MANIPKQKRPLPFVQARILNALAAHREGGALGSEIRQAMLADGTELNVRPETAHELRHLERFGLCTCSYDDTGAMRWRIHRRGLDALLDTSRIFNDLARSIFHRARS